MFQIKYGSVDNVVAIEEFQRLIAKENGCKIMDYENAHEGMHHECA